jgi:DNA-binding winged helix-turn-helix (wHTH) protein
LNSEEFVSKEDLLAAAWTDRKIDAALDKANIVFASLAARV